jgi:hypothetical protein
VIARTLCLATLLVVAVTLATCVHPSPASASVGSAACKAAGAASGAAGNACMLLSSPGKALSAGKQFLTGHFGSAIKTIFGGGGSESTASTALGLAAMVTWVVAGAQFSISETMKVLGETTRPQLSTTWFSSAYWRIAGIAALLTLPFLFAAAVQALLRSDLTLLTRATFGYLPLAMLAVGIAAPVTMLLLAATDQLCGVVSSAAGAASPHFDLAHLSGAIVVGAAPFLRFLVAVVTTACAIVLWLELTVREAAVYVIVLMMPLAFAALIWPSRRVWALRSVELLVALILSKLAIVAVLELGGAALDQLGHHGLAGVMAGLSGTALLLIAALSPWAVLRLVPMAELASGAVDSLRASAAANYRQAEPERKGAEHKLVELAAGLTAWMRAEARDAGLASARMNGVEAGAPRMQETPSAPSNGAGSASRTAGSPGLLPAPAESVGEAKGSDDSEGSTGSNSAEDQPGGRSAQAEERLPGLGPMFQAPNGAWRPLILGPDEDWSAPRLWPPDGSREGPAEAAPESGRLAEEHDPLPPAQEKPEGSL